MFGFTRNKVYSVLIIDEDVEALTSVVIKCIGRDTSFVIHILSLNLKYPAYRFSKYISSFCRSKAGSDDEICTAIIDRAKKIRADIIIPIKERTVRIVAERTNILSKVTCIPPLPDPNVLALVRNKWHLYTWLYNKSLLSKEPLKYVDLIQNDQNKLSLPYPVLIKPFWGSGGRGIHLIHNESELMNFKSEPGFSAEHLLVHPFIKGHDIDFSGLVIGGEIKSYSIQKALPGNKLLKYSKSIEFVKDDQLYKEASFILSELNYTGIVHLDFRYNEENGKYELIDFNARFWSSLLASLNVGINFPALYCQSVLGIEITKKDYLNELYYIENNPFTLLLHKVPFRISEFRYNVRDPLQFLAQLIIKLFSYFRNKLKLIHSSLSRFSYEAN